MLVLTTSEPNVLVLNGGASSGKSRLGRLLQDVLPGYWLHFSVDALIEAAPQKLFTGHGIAIGVAGVVSSGADFETLEQHWMAGVAAMAKSGAHIIVEDNFVSGPAAQRRWQRALQDEHVGWVGVRCAPDIAAAREASGAVTNALLAAGQADIVHDGIEYDVMVNTGRQSDSHVIETIMDTFFASSVPSG